MEVGNWEPAAKLYKYTVSLLDGGTVPLQHDLDASKFFDDLSLVKVMMRVP